MNVRQCHMHIATKFNSSVIYVAQLAAMLFQSYFNIILLSRMGINGRKIQGSVK